MRLAQTTDNPRGPGWRPSLVRRWGSWLAARWRGWVGRLSFRRATRTRRRFWKPGDPAENFFRRDLD